MGINLQKGQAINLEKDQFDLSIVTVGLGWDVRKSRGSISKLFGLGGEDYDLDAVAFLLNQNGKMANYGDNRLVGSDVIFFNNMMHSSGNIWLTGDNRTGAGDGDDEQIVVRLNALGPQYDKVLFIVQIYEGMKKGQNFSMVQNAYIRAVDAKGREIARFSLSGDATFSDKRSLVFAELYRKESGWKFRAIGNPYIYDSFVSILKSYV